MYYTKEKKRMIVTEKEKALWYELWTVPQLCTYDVRVDLPQYA
jgi:hypothetical protein